jgi:hypothetical protein
MKQPLAFFNNYWNLVATLVSGVLLLLANIIHPPEINLYFAESQIDLPSLIKVLAMGFSFLLLILFNKYKKKIYLRPWIFISALFLILSMLTLYAYKTALNKKSAYNTYTGRRQVIGQTFLAQFKPLADSVQILQKGEKVNPSFFLERTNSPLEIWERDEIEENSEFLCALYLITILSFYLFFLFVIQAFYCSTRL